MNLPETHFEQNSKGWTIIHTKAKECITTEKKNEFVNFMKQDVAPKLPCYGCRVHCEQYVKDNDMTPYFNVYKVIGGKTYDIGIFEWTWKFHNNVNTKLYRKEFSFDDAFNKYYL